MNPEPVVSLYAYNLADGDRLIVARHPDGTTTVLGTLSYFVRMDAIHGEFYVDDDEPQFSG